MTHQPGLPSIHDQIPRLLAGSLCVDALAPLDLLPHAVHTGDTTFHTETTTMLEKEADSSGIEPTVALIAAWNPAEAARVVTDALDTLAHSLSPDPDTAGASLSAWLHATANGIEHALAPLQALHDHTQRILAHADADGVTVTNRWHVRPSDPAKEAAATTIGIQLEAAQAALSTLDYVASRSITAMLAAIPTTR